MASQTMDAALEVEAAGAGFPYAFPFPFGPAASAACGFLVGASSTATATTLATTGAQRAEAVLVATATAAAAMSCAGHFAAALGVTAARPANIGMALYADAAMAVSTVDTFPYVFPFVFGASPDKASRGQRLDAPRGATVTAGGAATRGAVADVARPVTATSFVLAISGGEHPGDVAATATATAAASMSTRHASAAALAVTAGPGAHLGAALRADAHRGATASFPTVAHWQAHCAAVLAASATTASAGTAKALMDAATTVLAGSADALTRHQYAQVALVARATADASQFHDVVVDAALSVRAGTTATVPQPTGFWNFFLR